MGREFQNTIKCQIRDQVDSTRRTGILKILTFLFAVTPIIEHFRIRIFYMELKAYLLRTLFASTINLGFYFIISNILKLL